MKTQKKQNYANSVDYLQYYKKNDHIRFHITDRTLIYH